jgi:hypothetical protein
MRVRNPNHVSVRQAFLERLHLVRRKRADSLVGGRIDDGLSREIKDAVRSLENIQVKDLMKLLASVKAPANVIAIEQRWVSTSAPTSVTTDRQKKKA